MSWNNDYFNTGSEKYENYFRNKWFHESSEKVNKITCTDKDNVYNEEVKNEESKNEPRQDA